MKTLAIAAYGAGFLIAAVAPSASYAGPLGDHQYEVNVTIDVQPYAALSFQSGSLLYLLIPPPGSTAPTSGVNFVVTGNADATLVAEPDDFILVDTHEPGLQPQYLGRAILNGDSVGYKLELRFPNGGFTGGNPSFPQYAALPGNIQGPTVPPLTVDLTTTGYQRTGVIHMETSPNWTMDGGIPLPGLYVGQVTMTLTASN